MWAKLVIGLLISSPAWAWKYTQDFANGFYWQSLPISISVVDANPTRKSNLERLSQMAIREWERGTDLDLWVPVGSGTSNIIRWSDNFQAETNMDPLSVLAVAIRYTGGPYFARTEIIVNGSHPFNQNDVYLLTTLTHELGHTMGLDHSDHMEAIMAPTLQMNFQGVQIDDVRGMRQAYQETQNRQVTGFVSPLAYEDEEETNAMSCATVAPVASTSSSFASLGAGLLIAFVRKLLKWVKSLF